MSQVKKWGCEASLSNSAQPRCFSSIDPPLTQPRQPGMRQCRHINSSSESAGDKNDGGVGVVVVGWGCLGDRIGASTPRRLWYCFVHRFQPTTAWRAMSTSLDRRLQLLLPVVQSPRLLSVRLSVYSFYAIFSHVFSIEVGNFLISLPTYPPVFILFVIIFYFTACDSVPHVKVLMYLMPD